MKLWRGEGIRCVMYIDDGIIMSEGREEQREKAGISEVHWKQQGW